MALNPSNSSNLEQLALKGLNGGNSLCNDNQPMTSSPATQTQVRGSVTQCYNIAAVLS